MGNSIKDIKNPIAIIAIIRFAKRLVEMAIKKEHERITKTLKGD